MERFPFLLLSLFLFGAELDEEDEAAATTLKLRHHA